MTDRPLTFAEKMALKKAERLANPTEESHNVLPPSETPVQNAEDQISLESTEAAELDLHIPQSEIDWSKLSFKEKLELKKKGIHPPTTLATQLQSQHSTTEEQEGQAPTGSQGSKETSEGLSVGKVILLANEANKAAESAVTEGELLTNTVPDSVHIIRRKIEDIQSLDGVSLRTEMDDLQKLLKSNPQACMYLLPEDLGLMVRQLRKITDNKIAATLSTTKTSKKAAAAAPTKLTAEEMQAAFDDL
jgi:hypothetical protein